MLSLKGKVSSGLQKAGDFMKKEVYVKQYCDKLGFMPYHGTLNIKLNNNITLDIGGDLSDKLKKIDGNNTYGDVLFLEATISTLDKHVHKKGAILFPEKTVYNTDTLEFVASERLRDTMCLTNDDYVIITIEK